MSSSSGARPGDVQGWVRLSPDVKAYERARAGTRAVHVTRPADVAALDALLQSLRPGPAA